MTQYLKEIQGRHRKKSVEADQTFTKTQAGYLGMPVEGPYKPEYYHYKKP